MKVMSKSRNIWLGAILFLIAVCVGCSSDNDNIADLSLSETTDHSLCVIARQGSDAPVQYKEEMPLFSLDNIKSFNIETGELTFEDVVLDTHLFYDISCRYHVFFYDGDDLLFEALAVSWLSSAGYFNQLTFQCDCYGPDNMLDTSKSHFYLRYGYPDVIEGDETIEELKKKNAAGMERFISILRQAHKIVNAD